MSRAERRRRTGLRSSWSTLACWLVAGAVAVSAATAAADPAQGEPADAPRVWTMFPDDSLYPQYIADPLRPQSAITLVDYTSSGIPDTGDTRFLLRLGGRYSIARLHPAGQPDRGWQIDFEGGFYGQFDIDNNLDNIGWDGLFGLRVSHKGAGPWAFSFGTRHDSGHVGDEYALRTGRQRIDYTREEFVVDASWAPNSRWRAYAEAGWATHHLESEDPLRLQFGVEHTGEKRVWKGLWYAAVDVTAYKEDDLQTRVSGQLGLIYPTDRGTNRYRLGLEVVTGRSVLGEFSEFDETYAGFGWYFDF